MIRRRRCFISTHPYEHSTRSDKRYQHEMTSEDHAELAGRIAALKGKAVLSGYANPAYQALKDWERIDWVTACHAVGRTRASNLQGAGSALAHQGRTETVWIKPDARPRQLSLWG